MSVSHDEHEVRLRHGAIGVSEYHTAEFHRHAEGDVAALLKVIDDLNELESEEVGGFKEALDEADAKIKELEDDVENEVRTYARLEEGVRLVIVESRLHTERKTGRPFVTYDGAIAAAVFFEDLAALKVFVEAHRRRW